MISAVLFDLYETLITESVIRPTRASSLASALGLEQDAYRREWKARRPAVVRGQMSFAEALMDISQNLIGKVDLEGVQRICQQRIREKSVAFDEISDEIALLVATLAGRGVRLAVVSNGFEEDVVGWSVCSLADKFRCAVFSCRERVAKPEPEMYRRALHRLGVDRAETVYIGDGADDELAGAAQTGLRAVRAAWFVPAAVPNGRWTELAHCKDVLKFVEAG